MSKKCELIKLNIACWCEVALDWKTRDSGVGTPLKFLTLL